MLASGPPHQVLGLAHLPLSQVWILLASGPPHEVLGHDEKGRIAPHKHKRQPLIEVSDVQLAADDNEGQ